MEFTDEQQQEINKKVSDATKALEKELADTKAKLPKELSDAEKALKAKENDLWNRTVNLTFKENGLDKFADIISAKDEDDLKNKVESLNKIMSEMKIDNSYKPNNHQKTDEYEQAKKKHDTVSMLKKFFN